MARKLLLPALLLLPLLAEAQDAGALRARHAALSAQLADNSFGRPLHVESSSSGGTHRGEVHAVITRPYAEVAAALSRPRHWCDILALQVNVKQCDAAEGALAARITRRPRDALEQAHRIDFGFGATPGADYLRATLEADAGPMGTRDYAIRFEAAPLEDGRTFVRLSYAYTLGFMARIGMDAYLAGSGRDKIGFSVVGRQPDGTPLYADGVRGVIERSAMRHYLAVEAFLDSPRDLESRLRGWYAAIARYPQLAEPVGREEYLAMKRAQASRVISPQSRRRSGAASAPA